MSYEVRDWQKHKTRSVNKASGLEKAAAGFQVPRRFQWTPVCREPVTTCATFKCKHRPAQRLIPGSPMPAVKLRASTILGAFEEAQSALVGKAVVLTDGKAGTVENVWLDEVHGLRISIRGHYGKWPISTIKFAEAY